MRLYKWLVGILVAMAVVVTGVIVAFHISPSTRDWPHIAQANTPPPDDALSVQWLGTSTLLISDGTTNLLTDGYFSRASKLDVISTDLAPNPARIKAGLKLAGIKSLAAVMVVHSHFDHVMDAPWVAMQTGADLLGSRSTANVGRGAGMEEKKIVEVVPGKPMRYGDFEITFLISRHVPQKPWLNKLTGMGQPISSPLTPPAPVDAWKEGKSYAVMIRHPRGSMLIQGSAGFVDHQLDGYQADVAFVSSVGLFRQPPGYTDNYVRNTVTATGAKLVVPIHWDDFFVELTPHTPPLPRVMENLNKSWQLLSDALPDGTRFRVLEPTQKLYFSHHQPLMPPG